MIAIKFLLKTFLELFILDKKFQTLEYEIPDRIRESDKIPDRTRESDKIPDRTRESDKIPDNDVIMSQVRHVDTS
jgi:hypothetical protein